MYVFDMYEFNGERLMEDEYGYGAEYLLRLDPAPDSGIDEDDAFSEGDDGQDLATAALIAVAFREMVASGRLRVHHKHLRGGYSLVMRDGDSSDQSPLAMLDGPVDCWDFLYPMDSPGIDGHRSDGPVVRSEDDDGWAEWTLEQCVPEEELKVWTLTGVGWNTDGDGELANLGWGGLSSSQQIEVVENIADHDSPTSALAAFLVMLHPGTSAEAKAALALTPLRNRLEQYSVESYELESEA